MIDTQQLFNKTLDEIELRIQSDNEYDTLMISPLLRKLLVDGENSLISQIDKNKKPLRFRVNIREPLHKRVPFLFKNENSTNEYSWISGDGFNPDTTLNLRGYNPQEVNLVDFLKQVVIYTSGTEITVRDLIKHLSDKEGGVHKQRKSYGEEEFKNILLTHLGNLIGINNIPSGLIMLRTIAIIVVRDLSSFKK